MSVEIVETVPGFSVSPEAGHVEVVYGSGGAWNCDWRSCAAAAEYSRNELPRRLRPWWSLVGAIVLGTGPYRYERYVRDQSFCPIGMRTETIWDQTANLAACPIGYRCRDFSEIGTALAIVTKGRTHRRRRVIE